MTKSFIKQIIFLFTIIPLLFFPVISMADENIEEVEERIAFIEDRLEAGTKNARRWQYSWTTLFGVSTAFNGVSALGTINREDDEEKHEHFDYKVNGIKSALAFGKMIADPLTAYSAYEKIVLLPDSTDEDKIFKMRQGERLLKQCADREKAGRSWKAHALSVFVNLIAGAAIANDDNRTSDGVVAAATGIIVSEIQIFTMPVRAINDWKEYHRRYYFSDFSARRKAPERRFAISALPSGFLCTYSF